MFKQKLTFLCQSWMKLWNQRLGFLFLWPVPWIDVLLIQSLSQISRMEVYDGVVTSLIWPILIQLNTNTLTLFPRKYSSCCTNLESVAIPVVRATFMTSFWKDNISHVNTWLLVLNTFCIIKKRYGSSLSCSFWVFLSFPFLAPWDICVWPVTKEGQGCESCVQGTSPGLTLTFEPWAPAQRVRIHIYKGI